ncbi:adenomatous polyposis coli protein 2-like [Indicator indicator]|uniref:adenomatous polyposis coli protein 2-like n=1 Tax=Indicator indicator TaxID=1002788 RepID=UPI0023DF4AFD|nr:adenomatous polyposis coli protein 2-like [Indicator indicator]
MVLRRPRTRPPANKRPKGDGHCFAATATRSAKSCRAQAVTRRGVNTPHSIMPQNTAVLSPIAPTPSARLCLERCRRAVTGKVPTRPPRARTSALPRRTALQMAAQLRQSPPLLHTRSRLPGETHPRTTQRWKKGIDRAAARTGKAGQPANRWGADAPSSRRGRADGRPAGCLPAARRQAEERLPELRTLLRSPTETRAGGSDAPPPPLSALPLLHTRSALPKCCRRLGGTRQCANRRAEAAAPPLTETPPPPPARLPARPHLELALPPRAASPAASPARAPATVPLVPGPAEGAGGQPSPPAAGLRLPRPSLPSTPPIPAAGKGQRRLPGGRKREELPVAQAARCGWVSGDGLGFALRYSLPAERRALTGRPARQGGEAPPPSPRGRNDPAHARLNVTAPRLLPAAAPRVAHLGRGL